MLKAPPIISLDLHFSALFCYCQTYVDNIGQKLQKPRFVTLGAYNFWAFSNMLSKILTPLFQTYLEYWEMYVQGIRGGAFSIRLKK